MVASTAAVSLLRPFTTGLFTRQRLALSHFIVLGGEVARVLLLAWLLLFVSPRVLWFVVADSTTRVGVELVRDRGTKERAVAERDAVVQAAFRRGVLLLGAGRNTVRFSPPLVLSTAEADVAIDVFDQALAEVGA